MRIPQTPKKISEIMDNLDYVEFAEKMVRAGFSRLDDSRYLHWDEIRSRKPPGGFNHEEWWIAIKLRRTSTQRQLPFRSTDREVFNYSLPDIVLRETEFVAKTTAGHIGLGEEVSNPATRDRYLVNSLMEEAITSSQLEGASTERSVAKEMIRSGRGPRDRSEQMIVNNFRAMEFIGEVRREPLTVELICEIQRIVTYRTLDREESAGRLQTDKDDRVAIYDNEDNLIYKPPPAKLLPKRLQALCDFANADESEGYLPGVLRALTLHFMLGYEHPFEDGNGRTARLLFYWSMLNQGFWLTEYLSVSKIFTGAPARYARSFLYVETDECDMTYFYIYHLKVLHRAIDELHSYLARKVEEVKELRGRLKQDTEHFNHRQLALLHNALREPGATYSVQSHQLSHRISDETARKDLVGLEMHGLLVRKRMGKRFIYRPANDISYKIKSMN